MQVMAGSSHKRTNGQTVENQHLTVNPETSIWPADHSFGEGRPNRCQLLKAPTHEVAEIRIEVFSI